MRLVPPEDTLQRPFPELPERREEELQNPQVQPIPPLHRIPTAVLVMNAAHMQYVAANVYSGEEK
jgi:hypothetical protein